jgi:hypothetical protein
MVREDGKAELAATAYVSKKIKNKKKMGRLERYFTPNIFS